MASGDTVFVDTTINFKTKDQTFSVSLFVNKILRLPVVLMVLVPGCRSRLLARKVGTELSLAMLARFDAEILFLS